MQKRSLSANRGMNFTTVFLLFFVSIFLVSAFVSATDSFAPVAKDDVYYYDLQNSSLIIDNLNGVLANDEGENLFATLYFDSYNTSVGDLLLNSDGSFEYFPFEGFKGADLFYYFVTNSNSTSSLASISIFVNYSGVQNFNSSFEEAVKLGDSDFVSVNFSSEVYPLILDFYTLDSEGNAVDNYLTTVSGANDLPASYNVLSSLSEGDYSIHLYVSDVQTGALVNSIDIGEFMVLAPPVVYVPFGTIYANATSHNGAYVDFSANVSSDSGNWSCDNVSGSLFPFGTTIVGCTASIHGLVGEKKYFTVEVVDEILPVITLNGSNYQRMNVSTMYFDSGAVVTDNYDINRTIFGDFLGVEVDTSKIANYTVIYDATDYNGKQAEQVIRTIEVVDEVPPVVHVPEDIVVEANSRENNLISLADYVSATDNYIDGIVGEINCDPYYFYGDSFLVGNTTVTCTARDSSSKVGIASFNVSVVDTIPPSIDIVTDITFEATSHDGAAVPFDVPMTNDIVDGEKPAVCDFSSGDLFHLGYTVVTCSKTDEHRNVAIPTTFTINVVDTIPPAITLNGDNPQIIEVGSNYIELGADAEDLVDGNVTGSLIINNLSVDTSVLGSYPVYYDVADELDNPASVTRIVSVVDTTAPNLTLVGGNVTLNVGDFYNDTGATATDNYDGDLTLYINVTNGVNSAVEGTYIAQYNVSDSAGNFAYVNRTVFVNAVPVAREIITNVLNLSVSISNSSSPTQSFSGLQNISFFQNNVSLVSFEWDYGAGSLNFSNVSVTQESSGALQGSLIVSGIDLIAQNKTKTVYVNKLSSIADRICIEDAEILSITEISSQCDGANEVSLSCPGSNGAYTCQIVNNGTQYKISGLSHSGVIEYTYVPSSTGGSKGNNGGGGGGGGGKAEKNDSKNSSKPGNNKDKNLSKQENKTKIDNLSKSNIKNNSEAPKLLSGLTGAVIGTTARQWIFGVVVFLIFVGVGYWIFLIRKERRLFRV